MLRVRLLQLVVTSYTCVFQSPVAPKHRCCSVTRSARHSCLGWPAKRLGGCPLRREQWACCIWLRTHAPQPETGTGNPLPPGAWPVPSSHCMGTWETGNPGGLHLCWCVQVPSATLEQTASFCCSNSRSMLLYVPVMQRLCSLLKSDATEAVQSQWNVKLNNIGSMMHFMYRSMYTIPIPCHCWALSSYRMQKRCCRGNKDLLGRPRRATLWLKIHRHNCKGRRPKIKE